MAPSNMVNISAVLFMCGGNTCASGPPHKHHSLCRFRLLALAHPAPTRRPQLPQVVRPASLRRCVLRPRHRPRAHALRPRALRRPLHPDHMCVRITEDRRPTEGPPRRSLPAGFGSAAASRAFASASAALRCARGLMRSRPRSRPRTPLCCLCACRLQTSSPRCSTSSWWCAAAPSHPAPSPATQPSRCAALSSARPAESGTDRCARSFTLAAGLRRERAHQRRDLLCHRLPCARRGVPLPQPSLVPLSPSQTLAALRIPTARRRWPARHCRGVVRALLARVHHHAHDRHRPRLFRRRREPEHGRR